MSDIDVSKTRRSRKAAPKKTGRRILYWILLVLFAAVFCYCAVKIFQSLRDYKKGSDAYENLREQIISELSGGETEAPTKTSPTEPGTKEEEPQSTQASSQESSEPYTESSSEAGSEAADSSTEASAEGSTAAQEPAGSASQTENVPRETLAPNVLPRLSVNFDALKRINSDAVAWLQGQNNELSLPVVQCDNNEFYLYHLISGEVNDNGTLFVDCMNDMLNDQITVIYGHHMKSGMMFGSLEKYSKQSYLEQNPIFYLYTPEGRYTITVFSCFYTDNNETIRLNYATEEAFNTAMNRYIQGSRIQSDVRPEYGDKIVMLYTCAYQTANGRLLVLGRLTGPD